MGVARSLTDSSGFTLLELTVVLFLLGLVYALSGPMLDAGATGLQMKSAARQIAAGMRKARSTAAAEHRESTVTLDVEKREFTVSGDSKTYRLPAQLNITLFTAQSEMLQEKTGSIRFYPDGSSTGGRVTISAGESKLAIDVDWLTGRVRLL